MKEKLGYQPIQDDDESKSSVEMEDATLLSSKSRQSRWRSRAFVVLWAAVFLLLWTSLVSFVTLRIAKHNRRFGTRFLKSPANDYIVYEPQSFISFEKGTSAHSQEYESSSNVSYFTEPNEQIDRNWAELLEHSNIGFDAKVIEELDLAEDAIMFPDGTYYGGIMALHHLHCLKNLYHAMYPEYYNLTNMTPEQTKHWRTHTGTFILIYLRHCLYTLKQAVMCQGDTNVFTMKWVDRHPKPIGIFTSPHECVNWDRLMEWVKLQSVDALANGMLVHPKFGKFSFCLYLLLNSLHSTYKPPSDT
ncbi:hypothetical protein K469DRAFT_590401 [Zopfia rhizophila CBS 207.26]|uniref:Uncharacterized protein n=1 Tax=Zopfia rhizophila CBS 207.26 TaxID=1314779 RepID=A0A6A6DSG5_9PEZI|nr:hypothetical protein K469DRAFT_590401 [Zopfia rhizophila CBS 207.26]